MSVIVKETQLQIPEIGNTKELQQARYIQICFLERLTCFEVEVVNKNPILKTSGICGDIEKLKRNSLGTIKMLERIMGELES